MAFGWQGNGIRLVPLDMEKHLDNATRWMNDPEVTQWLLVGDLPTTQLAERDYFERQMRNPGSDISFAIEKLDGKHIGFSGIHKIDYRHGTATTGSFIGAKEEHGKGFGKENTLLRAQYCFEVLGLRVIYSGYLDGNVRSRGMLLHAGYQECGRLHKAYWKRGEYRDEILMYLERETWEASRRVG